MAEVLMLEAAGICKRFGLNYVLKDMNFQLRKGEVHALLGINGAGKSTLIKIISGAYTQDDGKILIDGQDMGKMTPARAMGSGIATIYQETSLYPSLSVLENLFVGRRKKKGPFLDWKAMEQKAREVFERMGVTIDLYAKVESIGKANAQLVEIARSLAVDAKVLIMDEPTASLSGKETQKLFQIITRLREQGTSIIYISHRMEEIFEVADRITVLRDGVAVGTRDVANTEVSWVTAAMLGKETSNDQQLGGHCSDDVLLEVQDLCNGKPVKHVSFVVHRGEIVALAGLVGAGRTEVARAVVGIDRYESGQVLYQGRPLKKGDFKAAIQDGIGLVPEDRGRQGLVGEMSAYSNFIMAALPKLSGVAGIRRKKVEAERVKALADSLMLNPNDPSATAGSFSGGNQQKVVIGKLLAADPELLILDEPTCGVDVSAKFEIYKLVDRLAAEGRGILVISSDLSEIETLADTIYVMRAGSIVKQLKRGASKNEILGYAIGGVGQNA